MTEATPAQDTLLANLTMESWMTLANLSDADLARRDIAEVNLLCAQGLPGAERVDLAACRRTLDEWANRVGEQTQRLRVQFDHNPEFFNHSWAYFRVLVLVTVLQRDIGIVYNPALIDREDFCADSRNRFIHGVLEKGQGTCSSLPPLYMAIGRRLDYPLKLVTTACHLFARWDEPGGERFNIECTSRGLNTHPDEFYLRWPIEAPPELVEFGCFLKSLSPAEEFAGFLQTRGHCCLENGRHREAAECYAWACELAPAKRLNVCALGGVLRRWDGHLSALVPPPWPSVRILPGPRRFPLLPVTAEADMLRLEAVEAFFNDPAFRQASKEPIRRSPHSGVPLGLPETILVRCCSRSETLD